MPRLLLSLFLLLSLPVSLHADMGDVLVQRALSISLHEDPGWLALLHVNRGGTLRGRGRSYVDDPAFFLAENGASDPRAEMAATVRELFSDGDAPPARCRFVARYRWLAERLAVAPVDLRSECPDYAAWRDPIQANAVVLVFPGSYLNSPSSMFGHTLLRIDPPPGDSETVWLSQAVSFGAEVRASDNSILYIWRGMAGGYPGRFQIEQYFRKIQEYGRMENRDLWEYPLDFSPEETAFMVDHLWELQGINFDYYFFDENCSYRLLELLEVARPSLRLTNEWRLSEVPVNTIRAVRDRGVASRPVLRPSAERELRARVSALSGEETRLAVSLGSDAGAMDDPVFLGLARDRQAAVLATAYARMVYRARKSAGRDPVRAERSLALLRGLNERGINPVVDVASPSPPEAGHLTRRMTVGAGRAGEDDRAFMLLGFRPSYHDFVDPPDGYLPGAELEIFDAEIRLADGRARLERLDVASVFSLSPHDAFFPNWSWRVRGGIERQLLPDSREHGALQVEGGGGLALVSGPVFWRAFAEARIEYAEGHESKAAVAAGPAIGVLVQGRHVGWQLDARPLFFADGFRRFEARTVLQWHLSRDWGLRGELRWRRGESAEQGTDMKDGHVSLHRYF